jgi:hypothetical protein
LVDVEVDGLDAGEGATPIEFVEEFGWEAPSTAAADEPPPVSAGVFGVSLRREGSGTFAWTPGMTGIEGVG